MRHIDILEPPCEVNRSMFVCWVEVKLGGCQSSSRLGWHVLRHTCTITKLHLWLLMRIMSLRHLINKKASFVYHLFLPLFKMSTISKSFKVWMGACEASTILVWPNDACSGNCSKTVLFTRRTNREKIQFYKQQRLPFPINTPMFWYVFLCFYFFFSILNWSRRKKTSTIFPVCFVRASLLRRQAWGR